MNFRTIPVFVLAAGAATFALAVSRDSIDNIGETRLKGPLGEKLDRMIERHVLGTDPNYITAPFMEKTETKGWWQTEFWGKWMHSAIPYSHYAPSDRMYNAIETGIGRILESQEPSGYIGNYPDELRCGEGWDVWGMKYTLMGLLHDYDNEQRGGFVSRMNVPLDAAKKLCDYVIAEIGPNGRRGRELWQTGNWSGYASSSILEPVVWLYRRTNEKKYLDFADYIVKGMTEPEKGPRLLDLALKGVSVADRNDKGYTQDADWAYVCKHGRSKAYEMMSCYQGILDYVEEKEKLDGCTEALRNLRKAAIMTADDIVKEEINLAGGCACSEAWYHGARKQHLPYLRLHETCVTTTWMRFCEKLLEVTDDPKWADQMERTFYNAYLAAMKPDGSEFAGYTPLSGNRWHGQHHCYMHTDCCTANGPRGFLCFLKELCRNDGKTATFNFYASALVKGFDMYSLYPRANYARIVSHTEGPLAMRLRIPAWSAKTVVKVNGAAQDGVKPGSYFTVSRDWKLGDIVEITFDMPVVAHVIDHSVAFTRGPVLLARDSRFADGDMTEPFRRGAVADGQRLGGFSAVRTPSDDIWMAFSATLPIGSHHENPEGANGLAVMFCDYASAGNLWQPANFYRTWFPIEYGPGE
ncbi:MAG: glycoside hydrolase family 127 protein [Kiritimatiellae bacterium]|nr:glycoside hydrolase family 127 protein [Kiritimatiellia bacterium]